MYRIESIEDTRSYDFDTGKAIPGSGNARPCDHCGTTHEIHVVIVEGSKSMTVGSTCAKNLVINAKDLSSSALLSAMRSREMHKLAAEIAANLPDHRTMKPLDFNAIVRDAARRNRKGFASWDIEALVYVEYNR